MSVKFTNTKKWDDVWFSELTMEDKVMFVYLCDMCDIAGFLEINERLIRFHTGIEDVRGAVTSLSKSVIYRDGYIWIMKYIKHQKNLPLNPNNNAHKGIISSMSDRIHSFPEIFDVLPEQDSLTLKESLTIRGCVAPSMGLISPTSKGNSNSNSNGKEEIIVESESKITRLYKYFVGEKNLMGQYCTVSTRKILIEALKVMDVEEWKVFCDIRLNDKFKASPPKFFLEDGWRRYQDQVKDTEKETKRTESIKKETAKIKTMPIEDVPEDFKEFTRNFGNRKNKSKKTIKTA